MKGRIVVLDQINGRSAAALMVDGRLVDLLIDPANSAVPRPGAIYRAVAQRPVKGQNGMMLDLGEGQRGFLRQAKGISPGTELLVQITTQTEAGKAAPATQRILFKGRYAILTPGAKGRNVARSIKDEAERDRLAEIAHDAMEGASDDIGLILRSAAGDTADADVFDEISALLDTCNKVLADANGASPCLLVDALGATDLAWRDWTDPDPDQVFDDPGSFEDHGVWDQIEKLRTPLVMLKAQASMFVEPTRALVAVDVNTGGDFSFSAGLKANLACVSELPRQLRLRGLGGQIVIDFAPMSKKDRRSVEHALKRALREDGVDTVIVGWTTLGHLELQRKRERLPLSDLLA
jgi:Ribonuclease G/E